MFRHKGRTLKHNLQIASLLSFVAGLVNVCGYLSVKKLTTNVTGHFAFLIDDVFQKNFIEGLHYFLYILFFFLGSFFSSFSVETVKRVNERFIFRIPVIIESLLLIGVGVWGMDLIAIHPNIIAYILLFAMGMQNSLVTTISNATVRTTHLTGLFTDLGIEISRLFFSYDRRKLLSSIKLRFTIILFFFLGGLFGGIFYTYWGLIELFFASFLLISGLVYDDFKIRLKWKFHSR